MPVNSRRKGHDFERAIATRLRGRFPESKRGYQSRSGADAPDVDGTPWHLECKHGRKMSPRSALLQGERATDGRPVVAVIRDHGSRDGEEIVVMRWRTFEGLLGER